MRFGSARLTVLSRQRRRPPSLRWRPSPHSRSREGCGWVPASLESDRPGGLRPRHALWDRQRRAAGASARGDAVAEMQLRRLRELDGQGSAACFVLHAKRELWMLSRHS